MLTFNRIKNLLLIWAPALFIILNTGWGVSACPCCHTCTGCAMVEHKPSHLLQPCCAEPQCVCRDGKAPLSKPYQITSVIDRHIPFINSDYGFCVSSIISRKIPKASDLLLERSILTTSVPPRAPPI